jgi:hypothetical protein
MQEDDSIPYSQKSNTCSYTNPSKSIQCLSLYYLKVHFNTVFPVCIHAFQNYVSIYLLLHMLHISLPSHYFAFIIRVILRVKYKL